ncbi:MAG: hypothetical protein ACE5H9_12780 [Anaerolineae bacterium]
MRTIDPQFTKNRSFWGRLWRDLRLLVRIARMLLTYLIAGGRIRRDYRARAARGEVYWVDKELGR